MKKKISIITICYNIADSIERTLRSSLEQTYQNLELIVVDGASTDGTTEVIKNVIADYPSANINFISEKDRGIYDAMNKGLARATGEWVIFMNGGDSFYDNETISNFTPRISNDTIIACGDVMILSKRYKYRAKPTPVTETNTHMTVFHQATFIRLSYHKKNLYDTSFRLSGDYNFFYNAYCRDNVVFQYIPEIVANFDGADGASNKIFKKSIRENLRIWHRENDLIFRVKIEYNLFVIGLKVWIKQHLLSDKMADKLEKRRLRMTGYNVIDITEE